ncbi:MAG: hypothetical protein Q9184_004683 [Pyrenodesmia sp. 2 TL-2023]
MAIGGHTVTALSVSAKDTIQSRRYDVSGAETIRERRSAVEDAVQDVEAQLFHEVSGTTGQRGAVALEEVGEKKNDGTIELRKVKAGVVAATFAIYNS